VLFIHHVKNEKNLIEAAAVEKLYYP